MGRISIYSALSCSALIAANTIVDNDLYIIQDHHHTIEDFSLSSRGCRYDDLPSENEIPIPGQPNVQVPIHGQWHCKTVDRSNKVVDANTNMLYTKDHCDLKCADGYGPIMGHLKDTSENPQAEFVNDYKIKAKRVVCNSHTKQWEPAQNVGVWPRCHNTCQELNLHNQQDTKAVLKCINLLDKECTPGINCHHASTCYAMCEDGFATQNKPKHDNEMRCVCNHQGCDWDIPKDVMNMGGCRFHMSKVSMRIIGGESATEKDREETKSNISAGLLTSSKGRKKRQAGESLIDHRRAKRSSRGAMKWQHICGGVLLTAQWAFTAAHCRTVGLRVLLGEEDFQDKTGEEVPCRVRLQIRHPQYDGQTYNDIMMLNIQCRRLKMGNMIWPARLPPPTSDVPWGADCKICGWGTMMWPTYQPAQMLQCVELPIMDRPTCNRPYANAIHDKIMCIGQLGQGGKDSCQGDSGGGAYCNGICYGLVMGGLKCADANYPGVYTVVANYVPWAVTVIRVYINKGSSGGSSSQSRGRGNKGCRGRKCGRRRRSLFTSPEVREAVTKANLIQPRSS